MAGGKVREKTRNKRGSMRDKLRTGAVEQWASERTEEGTDEGRMVQGKVDNESGPEA